MSNQPRPLSSVFTLRSVKAKLVLAVSACMIVIVVVVSGFNFFSTLNYIEDSLENQDLPTIADRMRSNINVRIFPYIYGSVAMANDTFLQE